MLQLYPPLNLSRYVNCTQTVTLQMSATADWHGYFILISLASWLLWQFWLNCTAWYAVLLAKCSLLSLDKNSML